MSAELDVRDISVAYSNRAMAVEGVSISVPEGAIVGVLGSNGAGKTTLLRAITGFTRAETGNPVAGDVIFDGHRISRLSPERVARAGIALVPERDKIFATLTVDENLAAVPLVSDRVRRRERRAFVFDLFPALSRMLSKQAGLLSGGERQMLALGRALLLEPKLLLADELSFGIALVLVKRMMESLKAIHDSEGISLLIVEQNAPAIFSIATHMYVMETGRVLLHGSADEVQRNDQVRAAFFGLDAEGGAA